MKLVTPYKLAVATAKVVIPSNVYVKARWWWWARTKSDRRYMERAILPAMANLRPGRVLFVGTQGYTRHYHRWFESRPSASDPNARCEYWTMDIMPAAAEFGSPGRHVTASVTEVDRHFAPQFFDIVFLNGVFGFGVDDPAVQATTLRAIHKIIRPGGTLLLGWNTDRVTDPLESPGALDGFVHKGTGELAARKRFDDCTHVYDLFSVI